jgi:diguanylate cyclase (GGDEF)-like protein/PAS domain S-box-containing protein
MSHDDELFSPDRLRAVTASGLLDAPAEEAFDRLTRLAARLLNAPVALVSIVDDTRQFFKSAYGVGEPWASRRGTPLSHSFCKHVVNDGELIVTDSRTDRRLQGNLGITELNAVAYAGVPLTDNDGEKLGAFCVIDSESRQWSEDQLSILRDLAAAASAEIRLRTAMIELDEREKTFEALIDTASAGILIRDRDGKIVRVNQAFCEMLGYEENDLLEQDIVALSHPDDAPIDEAFRKELLDGKRQKLLRTKRYRHKNGDFRWFELSVSTLKDAVGKAEATVAIVQDMSEKMRLREEVQRRDERYRTIVQHIPNAAILLYDRELRFISADGARVRSGEIDVKRFVGQIVADTVPPENRERIVDQYKRTIAGESRIDDHRVNGRTYAVHTVPVRDESGSIVAGMVFSYDITQQRQQANELRAATTRMSALIDHLSAGVLFEDEKRTIQLVNNAFCSMFGISSTMDVIGKNSAELAHVRSALVDADDFDDVTIRRIEDGISVEADRFSLKDGRVLERSYAPFEVPGVTSGHLWLYRDISEHERQRTKLARQTEELEKLSTHDELTQLLNRRGFLMIAEQQLKSAARGKRRVILFFADMNGMKEINDKLGHKMGDAALVDTAAVLRKTFREADLLARLGGDEFVALALDALPENKEIIETRLQQNFEALNAEPNRPYRVTVSVGSAMFDPEESRSIEALLAEADSLMYTRKKNRHVSGQHVAVKLVR